MNDDNPMKLPKGSVRAILALLIVAGLLLMELLDRTISDRLGTAAVMVIGFYFGTRSS